MGRLGVGLTGGEDPSDVEALRNGAVSIRRDGTGPARIGLSAAAGRAVVGRMFRNLLRHVPNHAGAGGGRWSPGDEPANDFARVGAEATSWRTHFARCAVVGAALPLRQRQRRRRPARRLRLAYACPAAPDRPNPDRQAVGVHRRAPDDGHRGSTRQAADGSLSATQTTTSTSWPRWYPKPPASASTPASTG